MSEIDYKKALENWMTGHGGSPEDIHAIHAALVIAAKLKFIGYEYQFHDQLTGNPVWRRSCAPWNGQESTASRKIYILDDNDQLGQWVEKVFKPLPDDEAKALRDVL